MGLGGIFFFFCRAGERTDAILGFFFVCARAGKDVGRIVVVQGRVEVGVIGSSARWLRRRRGRAQACGGDAEGALL
jgi:hypothetical protein